MLTADECGREKFSASGPETRTPPGRTPKTAAALPSELPRANWGAQDVRHRSQPRCDCDRPYRGGAGLAQRPGSATACARVRGVRCVRGFGTPWAMVQEVAEVSNSSTCGYPVGRSSAADRRALVDGCPLLLTVRGIAAVVSHGVRPPACARAASAAQRAPLVTGLHLDEAAAVGEELAHGNRACGGQPERGAFMRTPKTNCDIKSVDLAYNRLHNASRTARMYRVRKGSGHG